MQNQLRSPISSIHAALAAIIIASAPLGAQAPGWTFTEERRIGPPAAEFGAITDVALDGAGRLWIADGMSGELHVAEGDGLRLVAGPGQGPGELTPGAIEVVVLAGDTVLVIEPPQLRLHRFGPDGAYVRTESLSGEQGMTGGWRVLPDGRLAARLYPASVVMPGAPPPGAGDPVRAFDSNGRAGEELAMLPPMESFRMGDGPMPIITLLAPAPLWDTDERGRVLVASTHEYEVRVHAGGGAPEPVIARDVDAGRVGSDIESAARELLRETMLARRTPPQVVDQMVAAAGVSERAPVIGGVLAGPDGTIWVREAATTAAELVDLEQPGGRTWRIHDAQGREIATATLPAGFRPLEWRGNSLVGITRDALDQTSAVVLRAEAAR